MTDGWESAKQRLATSPALAAAVQREIANGLLDRIGAPANPSSEGANVLEEMRIPSALEAMTTPAALEAIVQRVARPPLLIRNDVVELDSGAGYSLVDFPAGTEALIKGLRRIFRRSAASSSSTSDRPGAARAGLSASPEPTGSS
jgi:endonuclease G, mitochondrial